MAEIRSFRTRKRIGAGRSQAEDDVDKKIQRHKTLVFYRILIVAILVVAVIAIVIAYEMSKNYTEYVVSSEVDWSDNSSLEILELGNNLMTYSKDGAVCSDLKGNTVWNQTYEMQNPLVSVSGEYAAIGDYNGTTVHIMNAQGTLGTVNMTLPLRNLRVSEKGTVVAIVDDNPTTWLYLYSKEGELLLAAKTSMADYGYPIDLAISADSKMLMVSFMYASGGKLSTRVAFYNLQGVGDNYQDNLVSAFSYEDAVVPMVRFMTNENSFAVADHRLMFYSGKEIPTGVKDQILTENLRNVVYSKSYVGLVYLNTEGGGKYRMETYNTAGNLVHKFYFDRDYKDIVFANEQVYVYSGSGCDIFNMNGDVKFSGDFEVQVERMIPGSTKEKMTLISKRKIQNVTLK